jgi:hypothetical protein
MNFIEIMNQKKQEPSDINEHLQALYEVSLGCDLVVELGVRGLISTYAFLASKPRKLISVDIVHPSKWGCNNFEKILESARRQNIDFIFLQEDSTQVEISESSIDLLFIDTIHTYDQVSKELNHLGGKVKKNIVFHDVSLYGIDGYGHNGHEPGNGILRAIDEFLVKYPEWHVVSHVKNNNGLMILGRQQQTGEKNG